MHSDNLRWSISCTSEISNRNRRSITGNDCWFFQLLISCSKNWLLHIWVFDYSLNNKINIFLPKLLNLVHKFKSWEKFLSFFFSHFIFSLLFFHPVLNKLFRLSQWDIIWIIKDDWKFSNSTSNNRDACSHLTWSNNSKWFDTRKSHLCYCPEHVVIIS